MSDHYHYEIRELREAISQLSSELASAWTRIGQLEQTASALESDTPQARQLQYEADLAVADLAASGYRDDEEW